MLKNKLKDFQKINPNLKDNLSNNIKYQSIKKIGNIDNAKIPEWKTEGSAGADLYSCDNCVIKSNSYFTSKSTIVYCDRI